MSLPNGPVWPRWWQATQLLAQPLAFLDRCAARFGDAVTLNLLGRDGPPVVLFGDPDAVRDLFADTGDRLALGEAAYIFRPLTGDRSLMLLDGADHQRQRQWLMPPLHGEMLRGYGQTLLELTEAAIAPWQPGQTIDVQRFGLDLSLKAILRVTFGLEPGPRDRAFQGRVKDLIDYVDSPVNSVQFFLPALQQDFGPWSPWGRFLQRRQAVDTLIRQEIADRRARSAGNLARSAAGVGPLACENPGPQNPNAQNPGPKNPNSQNPNAQNPARELSNRELSNRQLSDFTAADPSVRNASPQENRPARPDVLSLLLAARDEAGQGMTEAELRDQLVTLLLLGHDTTAAALAWALYWLHRDDRVRARLLAELDALAPDDLAADPEAIARLPYLSAVCKEVLRIYPVALLAQPRIARQPVRVGRWDCPAGSVLVPCIYLAHRRAATYGDPRRFRPERFLGRSPTAWEYFPFGGGSRACIGAALSLYELKLVLATVLRRYRLAATPPGPVGPQRQGIVFVPARRFRLRVQGRRCA